MAHRADDIRHDIEDTRAAMTEKLALLEECVRETITGAQASVQEIVKDVGSIVKDVRGTAEDVRGTVEDVKATVDTTLAAVRQGVAGAQSSVEEIAEHVKGTVGDTVATVQRTLDLPRRWSNTRGRCLAGHCWWAICSAAGVVAARRLLAPQGTPRALLQAQRLKGPPMLPGLEAPPHRARRPLIHSRSRGSSAAY
jgi:uncharacterized protein YoxC